MTAVLAVGEPTGSSGGVLLVLICLALFALSRLGGRGGRVAEGHSHGGKVRLHEGAHYAAAVKMGAPVKATKVSDGGGFVQLRNPDKLTPRQYMAFMYAGEAAAGGSGCSADRANIRQEKARMRSAGMSEAEIRRTERLAWSDAKTYARHADRYGAKL